MKSKQSWDVVSRSDFLGQGEWAREQYEGLLVVNHGNQGYDLGIELDQNRIVRVDQASAEQVQNRVKHWSARIEEVKQQFN